MSVQSLPDHVPSALVRDFDPYDFPGATEDYYGAWRAIQETFPPIFYTPYAGGYWVIARAKALDDAWLDADTFSSQDAAAIPPSAPDLPPTLPINTDDPFHQELRRPLNMAVSPKSVAALSPSVRALARELIDDLKPRGGCDFVKDFSLKLPMEIFLKLVDLPSKDREYLIGLSHAVLKSGDPVKRTEGARNMQAYIDSVIRERRAAPKDDLLSKIVTMTVEGRPLSHWEALGYGSSLLFGGLDTVGTTMSLIALHLATHEEHRRTLAADPSLIPVAIEEFFRRYSIPSVGRRVTRDMDFHGVQMKAGDRVILTTAAHGIDETRWPDALDALLSRHPRDHMAFGLGAHRCPGANLARAEIRVFLEEWLGAIPDFRVAPGAKVRYIPGAVVGLESLPLTWTAS